MKIIQNVSENICLSSLSEEFVEALVYNKRPIGKYKRSASDLGLRAPKPEDRRQEAIPVRLKKTA